MDKRRPEVLHIFDLYLPATLSWVFGLLQKSKEFQHRIIAGWILKNAFFSQDFRYRFSIFQRLTGLRPDSEFQYDVIRRTASYFHKILFFKYLYRFVGKPDLVHAHFGYNGCRAVEMAKYWDVPLVTSFYGFDYTKFPQKNPAYAQRYSRLFSEAAAIIAGSEYGVEVLKKMGCPKEKIRLVRAVPQFEEFPFVQRIKPPNTLRLVQVATFTEKKGHIDALRAFHLASADCPNMHLTLAGEIQFPEIYRALETYVRDHALGRRVELHGFVPHHELSGFLRRFDAFIHPSRHTPEGDHEDGPVIVLEAQHSGMPVLSTFHGGIKYIVRNGETGWLSAERDPEALAEHIRRVYRMDESTFGSYSQAAHELTARHFGLEQSVEALRAAYMEVSGKV